MGREKEEGERGASTITLYVVVSRGGESIGSDDGGRKE